MHLRMGPALSAPPRSSAQQLASSPTAQLCHSSCSGLNISVPLPNDLAGRGARSAAACGTARKRRKEVRGVRGAVTCFINPYGEGRCGVYPGSAVMSLPLITPRTRDEHDRSSGRLPRYYQRLWCEYACSSFPLALILFLSSVTHQSLCIRSPSIPPQIDPGSPHPQSSPRSSSLSP